jgi:hypothetical protein
MLGVSHECPVLFLFLSSVISAKDHIRPEKAKPTGDKGNPHYSKELDAKKS